MNYEKSKLYKTSKGLADLLWSFDFLIWIGGVVIAAIVWLIHHFTP